MYMPHRYNNPAHTPAYNFGYPVFQRKSIAPEGIHEETSHKNEIKNENNNNEIMNDRNEMLLEEVEIIKDRPLFRLFNTDIWLDDIVIIAVIILLISETHNINDKVIIPVLAYLFLSGKLI